MMSSSSNSLVKALNMKEGIGEHNYDTNSHFQRNVCYETGQVHVIQRVQEILSKTAFPTCIKVADVGCSSGQNSLVIMSVIVNTIMESHQQNGQNPPEIECYLNNLQENDFNTTFKMIPSFLNNLKTEFKDNIFTSGVPGSFYSRLFKTKSLHFLHSSFGIHWLSKVPDGLENNTKTIHIKDSSQLNVYKGYMNQFKNDFSMFLKMRSEESVTNGRMVLTFVGRKESDTFSNDCFQVWSLLSDCVLDLVSEGVVKKSEMESFNIPFYNPSEEEFREVILKEGSFEINKIEKFDHIVPYKIDKCIEEKEDKEYLLNFEAARKQASWARCITEQLLVAHFGDDIVEPVFNKYAKYMAKYLSVSNHRPDMSLIFIVSMTRI